jgi:SARP family transcriptional regulator, regulator of embCAB operon
VRLNGRRVETELPGRQGRLLFAYLAANATRSVSRDELIDALWPAGPPSAPQVALSALLSKVRRLLGEEVVTGRGELRLELPAGTLLDLEAARESVHLAEAAVAKGDWLEAKPPTLTARYISERRFLSGEEAPWIEAIRREVEEIHLCALECDAELSLGLGGLEESIATRSARRLVELAPYRESGYCLLMRALARAGNPAEAIKVFDGLRRVLRDELGTVPSQATQDLHSRLLRVGAPGS